MVGTSNICSTEKIRTQQRENNTISLVAQFSLENFSQLDELDRRNVGAWK